MKPGTGVKVGAGLLAVLFVAPTIIVIGTSFTTSNTIVFPPQGFSFQWYEEIFSTPRWTSAFVSSIQVGLIAAGIAMVLGTLLATGAARAHGIIPGWLILALAISPMVVPTVVTGLSYYVTGAGLGVVGSPFWLAFAHAVMGMPFVFINVLASLGSVPESLEEAAQISGATPLQTLLRITIPLVSPSIVVGGVLAFISSFDEVIVASFLTSPFFRTLPVQMFADVTTGAQPSTSAVAATVTAATLALLALSAAVPMLMNRRPNRARTVPAQKASAR